MTVARTVVSPGVTRSPATTPPPGTPEPVPAPDAPPPGTELGPHYHRCFGCGADHPTGLRLAARVRDERSVTASFTVGEEHQGAPGLAHGGVLATAMDEAIGMTVWLLRTPYVTGRLEVDYRRPVPVGTTLHIVARVNGVAERKAYLEAEARMDDPAGPVAVHGAALFIAVGFDHFAEHGDVTQLAPDESEVNP